MLLGKKTCLLLPYFIISITVLHAHHLHIITLIYFFITFSCKWVGLFVILWAGFTTVADLWNMLGNLAISLVSFYNWFSNLFNDFFEMRRIGKLFVLHPKWCWAINGDCFYVSVRILLFKESEFMFVTRL